jgi:NADH-quinone oxidoreductase subunit L
MHHEQDMKKMGAIQRFMPITSMTFLVGWLAIAGVPPFAGFWSKDDILLAAYHKSPILWFVGLVTALLTAYYMTRQVYLVFFGKARFDEEHHAPHESPWVMTVPLVVLAIAAALGGGLNLPFNAHTEFLHHFLHPVFGEALADYASSGGLKVTLAAVATVGALIGIFYSRSQWSTRSDNPSLEPELLAHAYEADTIVDTVVVRPSRALADAALAVDTNVVDGAVNGLATVVGRGGGALRAVQNGYVRSYALMVAGGAALLLAYVLFRSIA